MDTTTSPPNAVNARTLLLPYALALVTAMAIIQAAIAFTPGGIAPLAGILTAVVAAGVAVWLRRNYAALARVRFGAAIAHTIAFATVTTSFNAHAVIRALVLGSGAGSVETAPHDLLGPAWFGATLVMSAAWGVGLLIHLVGAVLGRGWED